MPRGSPIVTSSSERLQVWTLADLLTEYSIEEEQALYELLDLDAEGEDSDDVDVEFDETTEQVIIG